MAGRQRHELFQVPAGECTVDEQDRTNALLPKICEGPFEIALEAQSACRRLQVCDLGLDIREPAPPTAGPLRPAATPPRSRAPR
jgi:hypothetical protein